MKTKKALSALLAVSMATALTGPAFAEDEVKVDHEDKTMVESTGSNSSQTELTGTIVATQLKVTVPTAVAFTLDPTAEITDGTSQVTEPENMKIKNSSLVPIYTRISAVSVETASLVDDKDALSTEKAVMLGYRNNACDLDLDEDWLTVGRDYSKKPYVLNANKGKIDAGTSEAPAELDMHVYAASTTGWSAGETFKVIPTITISAKEFVATPGE